MKKRYVRSTKPFAIRIMERNLLLLRQALSPPDQRLILPLAEPSSVFVGWRRVFKAHQSIRKSWPTWQSWPSSYFHRLLCRFEVGQLHPFSAYHREGEVPSRAVFLSCLPFVTFLTFCSKTFSLVLLSSGHHEIWRQSSRDFDHSS